MEEAPPPPHPPPHDDESIQVAQPAPELHTVVEQPQRTSVAAVPAADPAGDSSDPASDSAEALLQTQVDQALAASPPEASAEDHPSRLVVDEEDATQLANPSTDAVVLGHLAAGAQAKTEPPAAASAELAQNPLKEAEPVVSPDVAQQYHIRPEEEEVRHEEGQSEQDCKGQERQKGQEGQEGHEGEEGHEGRKEQDQQQLEQLPEEQQQQEQQQQQEEQQLKQQQQLQEQEHERDKEEEAQQEQEAEQQKPEEQQPELPQEEQQQVEKEQQPDQQQEKQEEHQPLSADGDVEAQEEQQFKELVAHKPEEVQQEKKEAEPLEGEPSHTIEQEHHQQQQKSAVDNEQEEEGQKPLKREEAGSIPLRAADKEEVSAQSDKPTEMPRLNPPTTPLDRVTRVPLASEPSQDARAEGSCGATASTPLLAQALPERTPSSPGSAPSGRPPLSPASDGSHLRGTSEGLSAGEEASRPLLQAGLEAASQAASGARDGDGSSTGFIGTAVSSGLSLGRKRAPQGYQPVSTEEAATASTGLPGMPRLGRISSTGSASGRSRQREPLRRDHVGLQRLTLRDKFNLEEISAMRLMKKYDTNKDGVLEPSELVNLLKDYNKGVAPKQTDVEWLMIVADKDQSHTISADEVLYLVNVWYAFNNMPASVNACIGKYLPSEGPLLDLSVLTSLLRDLNDFLEVAREEAEFVRCLVQALGATEERVTSWQLRQAVAAWYLDIEREQTDVSRLAMRTVQDSAQFIRSWSGRMESAPLPMDSIPLHSLAGSMDQRGEPSAPPPPTPAGHQDSTSPQPPTSLEDRLGLDGSDRQQQLAASRGYGNFAGNFCEFIYGVLVMDIANRHPAKPACPFSLSGLLWWHGFLNVALAMLRCITFVVSAGSEARQEGALESLEGQASITGEASELDDTELSPKCLLRTVVRIVQSIFTMQAIFSAMATISSSASECGGTIYTWCLWLFALVPCLMCVTFVCVLAVIFVLTLSEAQSLDQLAHMRQ